jgi:KTSC domain
MTTKSTGVGWRIRRAWLLLAIVAGVGLSCDGPVSEQPIGSAPAASREHSIERTAVRSTALRSVGYDEDSQTLEIEFTSGAVYQYFDVPPEVYRGLMAAESHGRYFNQAVRNAGYRYQRMY